MNSNLRTRDISDGVCAYLMGGLGNQLFILAAAYQQSLRLNCPLYIDSSRYSLSDPRSFELTEMNLPGTVITNDSPWATRGIVPASRLPFKDKLRKKLVIHKETNPYKYESSIEKIQLGTTLFGYFQSPMYFAEVEDLLFEFLKPDENKTNNIQGNIAIHARRGDYLNPTEANLRGVTSLGFFKEATNLIRSELGNLPIWLFTDSPEVAIKELNSLKKLNYFDDTNLSALQTLRVMSTASAIVTSNSSFSWWAAWLLQKSTGGKVISPIPWMTSNPSANSILLPEWVKISL